VVLGSYLDQTDVVVDIPADHRGRHALAVTELDEDRAGCLRRLAGRSFPSSRDHMGIGEDVALARNDEARSLGSCPAAILGMGAEDRDDRDHTRGPLAIDLCGIEVVAGEGFPARIRVYAVGGRRRRGLREDNRVGLASPEPTGRLCDRERSSAPQQGADDR